MSHQPTPAASPANSNPPRSIPELTARKGGEKIVVLTAYTAPMAELLDAHCDMLLVGDSLGMVVYGMDSTLPVTLEMMIAHGTAVQRRARQAVVVIDMPFGSYQESKEQAFRNAARILKETGAAAVKIEGGTEMAETIRYLSERAVPVLGHVGLMPQHVHRIGGFKAQGRDAAMRKRIMEDAKATAEAGAFAMVIEGVVEPLAADITRAVAVPTIGIGASPLCDGQVLVVDDMLGMFARGPKFVKRYANLREEISAAAAQYAAEVKSGAFPAPEHCYGGGPKKATA